MKFRKKSLKKERAKAVLPKDETFEEYVARMDREHPFDFGWGGKARLFPQKRYWFAYRPDVKRGEDYSPFRKIGIGWKWNPTLIMAFIFFLPPIFLYPLLYYIYGHPEVVWQAFWMQVWRNAPFIIFVAFFTGVIKYAMETVDELLRPYGEYKDQMKDLFIDELEYSKFAVVYYEKAYTAKWMWFGLIIFIGFMTYSIISLFNLEAYRQGLLAPLPDWTIVILFIRNIGIGLVIFQFLVFFVALVFALFHLGSLGANKDILSINKYEKMLTILIDKVMESFRNEEQVKEPESETETYGQTYYEFQRANKRIGEFLFNIALYLIIFFIIIGIVSWVFIFLRVVDDALIPWYFTISILSIVFIWASIGIFILPQIYVHGLLNKFKNNLIDYYSILSSRLEFIYYQTILKPEILSTFKEWNSRRDLLDDLKRVDRNTEKVKDYITWSYDFPNRIKNVIFVSLSPVFPLIFPLLRVFLPYLLQF